MDDGYRKVRAARNESLWREVNERIKQVAETSGGMEFLCECADMDCKETLQMSIAEYERVRSNPTYFSVATGHEWPDVERVVEQNERYLIVEKLGVAAEVAMKLDAKWAGEGVSPPE